MGAILGYAEQLIITGYILVNDFVSYGLFGQSIFF